jgi:hypothetical protein
MSAATRSPSCATPCKAENPVAAQKKLLNSSSGALQIARTVQAKKNTISPFNGPNWSTPVRAVKILAILALAAVARPAFAQEAAPATSHDGHWRVEIETTVGNCPKSGVAVLTVKNNKIAGIDASSVDPWGYIDETNTFVGHFTSGEKVLRANGEVLGEFAKGPWSSQTEYCGGRWQARKLD